MKILVIGNGGREDAIVRSLQKNKELEQIWALADNGNITSSCPVVAINVLDFEAILCFCLAKEIDYVVVSPDNPLAAGLVDFLEENNILCFGPNKLAAEIESSKVFSKHLMQKYNIPTAEFAVFTDAKLAINYLKKCKYPVVVKADGLALGKGVIIAEDKEQAETAIIDMLEKEKFGESGKRILIEEFLEGVEVSMLSFTDGQCIVPMISSMDHKRSQDGDKGLNTGGMGVIAPNPYWTEAIAEKAMQEIFLPTIEAMNAEGRSFKGCLYFGLMITKDGVKVIEYNARFGDPEAQAILPLLKTDLLTIMLAVSEQRLADVEVEFEDKAACHLVLASKGYPLTYQKMQAVEIASDIKDKVFFAGLTQKDNQYYNNGGRVLGITAIADNLELAIKEAYQMRTKISSDNLYCRNDIGAKALELLKENN